MKKAVFPGILGILVVGFYLATAISLIDVFVLIVVFGIIEILLLGVSLGNSLPSKVKGALALCLAGGFALFVVTPTIVMHIRLANLEHEFLYGGRGRSYDQLLTERDQDCAQFGLTSTGWTDGDRGSITCLYYFTGDGLLFRRDIVRHTVPEDLPSRERA